MKVPQHPGISKQFYSIEIAILGGILVYPIIYIYTHTQYIIPSYTNDIPSPWNIHIIPIKCHWMFPCSFCKTLANGEPFSPMLLAEAPLGTLQLSRRGPCSGDDDQGPAGQLSTGGDPAGFFWAEKKATQMVVSPEKMGDHHGRYNQHDITWYIYIYNIANIDPWYNQWYDMEMCKTWYVDPAGISPWFRQQWRSKVGWVCPWPQGMAAAAPIHPVLTLTLSQWFKDYPLVN